MSRPDLRLTPAEIDAFMTRCTSMIVAAVDDDGALVSAVAEPEWANSTLTLRFHPDDPMPALIGTERTICATADEAPAYYEIKGITIHGTARPVTTGVVTPSIVTPSIVTPGVDPAGIVAIEITSIVSFDFGKIPNRMN